MVRRLLHTPEGVRDIYNEECEKKLLLQDELYAVLKQYGYHPIQTPAFEFLISLEKRLEQHRRENYTNFLTEREIHWCCGRI